MLVVAMRLIRGREIYGRHGITGKSRSSVYRDIKAGIFPAPVQIGRRAVAWRSTDIEVWVAGRTVKGAASDS